MQWFKIVFVTSWIKRNDSYCMLLDLLQVTLLVYIRCKLRSMIWSSGPISAQLTERSVGFHRSSCWMTRTASTFIGRFQRTRGYYSA